MISGSNQHYAVDWALLNLSGLSVRHWRKSFLLQSKIGVIFKERPTPAEEKHVSVDIWKVGTFAQALILFLSGSKCVSDNGCCAGADGWSGFSSSSAWSEMWQPP